jgi:hypothetical protein
MARKTRSRSVRRAQKPVEIALSESVAAALRNDIGKSLGWLLDLQSDRGTRSDRDALFRALLRTMRTMEVVLVAEMVAAHQDGAP